MLPMDGRMLSAFRAKITKTPRMYTVAMIGTAFSITLAILLIPPKMMTATIAATIMPNTVPFIPNTATWAVADRV